MSTSQFEDVISLSTHEPVTPDAPQSFTVPGTLETEDGVEIRQIHVFFLLEQTAQDLGHKAGSSAKAVGTGYVLREGAAQSLTTWSVKVKIHDGPDFQPGPATGTAMTVAYSYDPIGFETYAWAKGITLIE